MNFEINIKNIKGKKEDYRCVQVDVPEKFFNEAWFQIGKAIERSILKDKEIK